MLYYDFTREEPFSFVKPEPLRMALEQGEAICITVAPVVPLHKDVGGICVTQSFEFTTRLQFMENGPEFAQRRRVYTAQVSHNKKQYAVFVDPGYGSRCNGGWGASFSRYPLLHRFSIIEL